MHAKCGGLLKPQAPSGQVAAAGHVKHRMLIEPPGPVRFMLMYMFAAQSQSFMDVAPSRNGACVPVFEPSTQRMQSVSDFCPFLVLYFPAAHLRHPIVPGESLYVPGGHKVQLEHRSRVHSVPSEQA